MSLTVLHRNFFLIEKIQEEKVRYFFFFINGISKNKFL